MTEDTGKKEPTTQELKAKLSAVNKVQTSIMVIFGLIILAWIVLGYWKDNLPVFISTVAMAFAIFAMQAAIRSKLIAEVKKRESAAESTKRNVEGESQV